MVWPHGLRKDVITRPIGRPPGADGLVTELPIFGVTRDGSLRPVHPTNR